MGRCAGPIAPVGAAGLRKTRKWGQEPVLFQIPPITVIAADIATNRKPTADALGKLRTYSPFDT
jgi:hypothetical protein